MKVYLVSEIICFMDERMNKRFEVFKTKEDAIEYKEWLIEEWIADLADVNFCEEEDVEDFIHINYNSPCLWGFTNEDCSEEVEIEITELDLLSIK